MITRPPDPTTDGRQGPRRGAPTGARWPWVRLLAPAAILGPPSSALAAGYDAAAPVLVGGARSFADDLAGLQAATALGWLLWPSLTLGLGWAAARLARDVSRRHQLALGLTLTLLATQVASAVALAPVRDGDELVDYLQTLLATVTGLRPVELLFPTGWTLTTAALLGPWVSGATPAGGAVSGAELGEALVAVGPTGLLLCRALSAAAALVLAAALARRVLLQGSAAGAVLTATLWVSTLPVSYLLATCTPHVFAVALAWSGTLLLSARPASSARLRHVVAVGLLWGLAVGSHPLAAVVVAASLPFAWPGRERAAAVFGAGTLAAVAGWALVNPWAWEQRAAYVANARYRLAEVGAAEQVADTAARSYGALLAAAPVLAVALVVWGVAVAMTPALRQRRALVLPLVGWVSLAVLAALGTRFDRYLVWALPGLATAAGVGLAALVRRLRHPRADALLAGLALAAALSTSALRPTPQGCPGGLRAWQPLATVALRRGPGQVVWLSPLPQIPRAARAGLISPALAHGIEAALAGRLGGRAQVTLAAWDQRRPLPSALLRPRPQPRAAADRPRAKAAAGAGMSPVELWELRWQRSEPTSAPLRVGGMAPLPTYVATARCGLLLRGARLAARPTAHEADGRGAER